MKFHPRTRPAVGRTASAIPAAKPMSLAATALAAALLFATGAANAAPPERSSEGPWAKSRLLVVAKPGLSSDEVEKVAKGQGGKATRIGRSNIFTIDLPAQASETAVRSRLLNNPHFESVEFDQLVSANYTPNDPYYGSQWHLAKINSQGAWGYTRGSGVTIAILDSGVDPAHADLKDRLVAGWNFYDNNSNTSDVHGHGTAVAGAAAAATNNTTGVAAVAGEAKIMPVRIADANAYAYWSTVAKGVTWAADNGARVINISYVGVAASSTVQAASQYAKDRGGLVIVCAGNNGRDEGFVPTTTMIPVSATDSSDLKTSWSSWGNFVAMSAPGASIWTTTLGGTYKTWSGTSFASPVTAGVVAMMMAANPGLRNTDVENLLFGTAVDLGAAGRDPYFGFGRVNAGAAVAAAAQATATLKTTDTQTPTVGISSPGASSSVAGLTTVNVSATDNVGVSKVELWVNGTLLTTDTTAPYSFAWDTTKVANGTATLTAKAVDAAGNAASSAVAVNVANAVVADTTPPAVALANPASGSRVSGSVKVSASASDNSGVSGLSLALFINGSRVATATGSSSLSYTWNTRKIAAGTYTLRVDARDAAGNVASQSVTVTR